MKLSREPETTDGKAARQAGPKKPKWDQREIDRYLLRLAQATINSLQGNWEAVESAAKSQSNESVETAEIWRKLLALGPNNIGQFLLRQDQGGQLLRRVFPFFALAPRKIQEDIVRDTVRTGSLAAIYEERWNGAAPPAQFVDVLVEHLFAALEGAARDAFTAFVTAAGQTKWLIAADFCIADNTRPNDVFAFSVFPYDANFSVLAKEIALVFPKDLKNTPSITDEMIAFLRSRRRFHFVFVVNKNRKILANLDEARAAIERSIAMMSAYNDADQHRGRIADLKRLRQEANANGFNAKILQDIILLATFAGFIATLLHLEGRAEIIGFFPDQDKMTTAYGAIGYPTFAVNASSFALRGRVPEAQIALALPGPRDDGRKGLYYDELIRIPDYIAGGVAGTDLSRPSPASVSQKSADIVGKALIDTTNTALLRVDIQPLPLSARQVMIQSAPPASPDEAPHDPDA